jgi:S1-C subfamily serine protease
MGKRRFGRLTAKSGSVIVAGIGLPLALGCASAPTPAGGEGPQTATGKPATTVEKTALVPPKAAEPSRARVPSRSMLALLRSAPLAANPTNASTKSAMATLPEGGKGDVRENYRAVAPATVIIRTPTGLGTGVIINHTGWILTNNHVIDSGEREDFRIKVSVELGHLDKSGAMERTMKPVTAYVHKTDPVRDLAIIKLDGTHKDLPFIRPAAKDPTPGEPVASLGHAGSGLVWAIKDGEVAAVGKLSTHLSQLVSLECTPNEEAEDQGCKRKHAMFEGLKKVLDHDKPLQVVQSTCPNWPGDSGGPLVNRANELVGLNSFGYGNNDNRSTFHVHVSEIRSFLEEIPVAPADVVPDPWFDGGEDATVEDADLDGRYDVLRTEGRSGMARFFDLDQNTLGTEAGKPDVGLLYGKRSFDAEVIYLATNQAGFAWYDTDDDGRFDVMLHDEGGTGRVSRGFRIGKSGRLGRDDALGTGGPMIQPDLVGKGGMRDKLAQLGAVTLGVAMVELRGPLEQSLPDPLLGGGREVEVADMDGDGRMDTLSTSAVYSHGFVFDVDQGSVGDVRKNDAGRALLERKAVDAEATVISQGPKTWVYYDRNDDGKFDLVTFTPRIGTGVAFEAFRIGENGEREPAPEHVGRKVLRPKLLESAPLAAKLSRVAFRAMPSTAAAIGDDGLDSFPDPVRHGGVYFSFGDTSTWSKGFGVKTGWDKSIVVSAGMTTSALVIDVNRDSPAAAKLTASQVVDGGKFKADFAFLHRDGAEWTYYDTDGDGKYDAVLFTSQAASGTVERGYRLDASGAVTLDPSLAGGRMVRPSLFAKKPTQAQFKKLAAELFQARAIEP